MSCLEISQQGIILPVSEVYCRYKAPAHYDDLLEISTSLANTSKYSIRFNFLIHRLLDYRLLVKGYSIHSAIDRIGGRLINIPEKLQTALAQICEK
jgi:acyl-CoA thioester hydrolase